MFYVIWFQLQADVVLLAVVMPIFAPCRRRWVLTKLLALLLRNFVTF